MITKRIRGLQFYALSWWYYSAPSHAFYGTVYANFTSATLLALWKLLPGRESLPLPWENEISVNTIRNCPARWWQRWCFQQGCRQGLRGGTVAVPPASPCFTPHQLLALSHPPGHLPCSLLPGGMRRGAGAARQCHRRRRVWITPEDKSVDQARAASEM